MESKSSASAHVEALEAAYPRLFAKASTLDVWFPIGWTSIMNALCSFLDVLLDDVHAERFRVKEVREKCGMLVVRYSYDGEAAVTVDADLLGGSFRRRPPPPFPQPFPADAVDAAIFQAERLTATTCATCGAPGSLRKAGRFHVACDECEAKRSLRQEA